MATASPGVLLLPCERCGAGLPVDPDHARATCVFCGTETTFEASRFAAQRAHPALVTHVAGEGRKRLEWALRDSFHPSAALFAASVLGLMLLSAIVRGLMHASGARPSALLAFAPAAGWGAVGLVAVLFVVLRALAPTRAKRAVNRHMTSIEQCPAKGRCPACGSPVAVPAATLVVACHACETPLLVDSGLLVRWVTDAKERSRVLGEDAARVARETYRWTRRVEGCAILLVVGLLSSPVWTAGIVGCVHLVSKGH